MDYVSTKWAYCNKCDLPKAVAEIRISGWLHVFQICGDCSEKLTKKIVEETSKIAERAMVSGIIEKTGSQESSPIGEDDVPPLPAELKTKKNKDSL
jgi:hypothetical protein